MESKKWEFKISNQFGNRTHVKEDGKQIFVIEHYNDSDAEKREIENRIEKCVNAHEELVKALKSVLAYEKRGADKGKPRIGNGILSIIHEALRNVNEKE